MYLYGFIENRCCFIFVKNNYVTVVIKILFSKRFLFGIILKKKRKHNTKRLQSILHTQPHASATTAPLRVVHSTCAYIYATGLRLLTPPLRSGPCPTTIIRRPRVSVRRIALKPRPTVHSRQCTLYSGNW